MNNQNQRSALYPLYFALALIAGIYIGSKWGSDSSPTNGKVSKINQILNMIKKNYVDSVAYEALEENAIRTMLSDLDPHSYYINTKELNEYTDPLEGNFDGIGIEFTIKDDTIFVVNTIPDGPSEKVGVIAGDRIVKVDGDTVAGNGVTNKVVLEKLRGERGTKVKVGIKRRNQEELIDFEIKRDKIPLHSVHTHFMIDDKVGYIRVARFAKTTYDEFMESVRDLKQKGLEKLIVDLRGNGGGFLGTAVDMIEEFLDRGKLIVYTEGNAQPRDSYFTTRTGSLSNMKVAILIDEGSASASEIMAGAIQDNDRGIIVGRRSFGKGLVQEHKDLMDGSALRLTVARYYTPSGRCIQKPYGEDIEYDEDYYTRLEKGELISADSIQFPDSLKYTTAKGRIVYGGGGIMPDHFVPIDTVGGSYYLNMLSYLGILNDFAFEYVEKNREVLNAYTDDLDYKAKFNVNERIIKDLIDFAEKNEVPRDPEGLAISKNYIQKRLKTLIARNIFGNQGYYTIMLDDDLVVKKTLEEL